jgi:acetyl esterase
MSLDKQCGDLLNSFKEQGVKSFNEMSIEEARLTSMGFVELQGIEEPVGKVIDTLIDSDNIKLSLRVYYPKSKGPHPVLLYFHGGGFIFGNIQLVDKIARCLCNLTGMAVVSVDYRKAPENPYPAALNDAQSSLNWIAAEGSKFDLDSKRIAVIGDSAGGNLATVLTQIARDHKGPHIFHQVLVYPVTDAKGVYSSRKEFGTGYLLETNDMHWFFKNYLGDSFDENNPHISPIKGNLVGLPSATIISAGYDPLRDEVESYAEALKGAGVDVNLIKNPTMIHGFIWMKGVVSHADKVFKMIADDLKSKLKEIS